MGNLKFRNQCCKLKIYGQCFCPELHVIQMLLLKSYQLCGLGNLDGIICPGSDYPELHQAVAHQ